MYQVLIADALSPRAAEILRERGIAAEVRTGLSPSELQALIGVYDGLAVRSATKVTRPILEAAGNLKIVGRAGIGVDNIDVSAATQRGIVVMNAPHGNAVTTAEHAIALILALARKIPQANASTHSGRWEKERFVGMELAGKTLGIVGCGNVGSIVAYRAHGLKMRVIAYDPYLSDERTRDLAVEKRELDDLLRHADIITLHAPSTESTRHMIDTAALSITQPGVLIVNCARGDLIVAAALTAAHAAGHVA